MGDFPGQDTAIVIPDERGFKGPLLAVLLYHEGAKVVREIAVATESDLVRVGGVGMGHFGEFIVRHGGDDHRDVLVEREPPTAVADRRGLLVVFLRLAVQRDIAEFLEFVEQFVPFITFRSGELRSTERSVAKNSACDSRWRVGGGVGLVGFSQLPEAPCQRHGRFLDRLHNSAPLRLTSVSRLNIRQVGPDLPPAHLTRAIRDRLVPSRISACAVS
jgi:hypothetical protein